MIDTVGMNCDEIINKECELCRRYGIEKGDSLYQVAYLDTGIDFYEVRNIAMSNV